MLFYLIQCTNFYVLCFINVSILHGCYAAPAADLITDLPDVTFAYTAAQYSGYIQGSPGHHLHYWLTTSQSNPSTDPLILWLDGGPGCSSLAGLLFETGPFHVNRDLKTIFENVYAWNKKANVLYIESPVGVGFSYADDMKYSTNDDQTANDSYLALKDFFINKFPEYQELPFYISGASYAGIYVPMLAKLVVDGTLKGDFPTNLTGIIMGNGLYSEREQRNSVIPYMYTHGLISESLWHSVNAACCANVAYGSQCNYFSSLQQHNLGVKSDGSLCGNLTFEITETRLLSQSNPMRIYLDCYNNTGSIQNKRQGSNYFSDQASQINYDSTDNENGFPCWGLESGPREYFRRVDVQTAIHIPQIALDKSTGPWNGCSDTVANSYTRQKYDMASEIGYLLDQNIAMLIYNGDVDLVCNFLGTQWFFEKLALTKNFTVTKVRAPWLFRGQIGGYVKSWTNIDMFTIKGAGHLASESRSGPTWQILLNFLARSNDYSQAPQVNIQLSPLLNSTIRDIYSNSFICIATTSTVILLIQGCHLF